MTQSRRALSCALILLSASFVTPIQAFALLHFESRPYSLQGKVVIQENAPHFAINYKGESQTLFRLHGELPPSYLTQNGRNAELVIKPRKLGHHSKNEADLVEFIRYLIPFEAVKTYQQKHLKNQER